MWLSGRGEIRFLISLRLSEGAPPTLAHPVSPKGLCIRHTAGGFIALCRAFEHVRHPAYGQGYLRACMGLGRAFTGHCRMAYIRARVSGYLYADNY